MRSNSHCHRLLGRSLIITWVAPRRAAWVAKFRKSSRLELEVSSYSIEWAYTQYILLRELPNQVDLNGTYRLQYAERLVTILSRAPYYLRYSSRKQMLKIVLNAMERKEKEINIPKGTTLLIAAKICTGLE